MDLSRVYSSATSSVLARLVSGDPEDRKLALAGLLTVCAAAGPVGRQTEIPSADGADEVGAAAARAWQMLSPALDLFCREGIVGGHGCEEETGTAAPAASLVLWARAEVLTLLRSFGGGGGNDGVGAGGGLRDGGNHRGDEASSSAAEDRSSTGEDAAFIGGASDTCDGDGSDGVVADVGYDNGGGGGGGGGGSSGGGSEGRRSPSSQLSVPFLRVAELVMGAFDMRVSPEDVNSWASRSSFLGTLVAVLRSGVAHGRPGKVDGEKTLAFIATALLVAASHGSIRVLVSALF